MNINRKEVTAAFAEYTNKYNAADSKIKLKIDHTYRVADLCEKIVVEEHLDEKFNGSVRDLAWLTGMLHDVGRFEQIRRFGTFEDAKSIDHATLGADLLFGELEGRGVKRLDEYVVSSNDNLLEMFIPDFKNRMSREELFILELAIRNHSLYRIQPNITDEQKMYCDVLRDADKIDIFRVNCETPKEEIYNVTTEDLKTASVTPEVKQSFDEGHCVLRALKKTSIDHIVGHVSLLFELVYPTSVKIAKDQGYIYELMNFPSENEDTKKWFAHMREVIN